MAHEHRSERPPRRGRVDDTGGDAEGGRKLYYHLTLLAENDAGYRNLIQLASLAFLEGYYYKPRLDWELLERHHEGLIATTGCLGGHVLQSLLQGDEQGALDKAGPPPGHLRARTTSSSSCRTTASPAQRDTNPQLLEIAQQLRRPLLATNDSHYTHRDDHLAHDALLCVQTGALMSDPKRFKFEGDQHYLKPAAEMRQPVPTRCPRPATTRCGSPSGPTSTSSSASPSCPRSRCPRASPTTPTTCATSPSRAPSQRWGEPLPAERRRAPRLRAQVIADMGFSSYFLIVWDLIRHARDNGHPGRARAGERGRAARWPTACASPTSTPSATTCCSSASSTRAASRCPTSTWTSTPATATR